MNIYRKVFPKKHTFIAVIHVEGGQQAVRNVRRAKQNGADGVFLINHRIPYSSLIACFQEVQRRWPDFWVGLNCLDLGRTVIDFVPSKVSGLWVDNAGIDESNTPTKEAEKFSERRRERHWYWSGLYFGGVAFKYQTPIIDVAWAARLAMPYVDVITTSGEATGSAPDVDKICRMKEPIGDHPLAIASGVTSENVTEYKPYADCFLVATDISSSFTELDPVRVRALANKLS